MNTEDHITWNQQRDEAQRDTSREDLVADQQRIIDDLREHVRGLTQELDKEQRRWQDRIDPIICRYIKDGVDGSGCDSGDPLDLTATELELAFGKMLEEITTLIAENQRLAEQVVELRERLEDSRKAYINMAARWNGGSAEIERDALRETRDLLTSDNQLLRSSHERLQWLRTAKGSEWARRQLELAQTLTEEAIDEAAVRP